MKNNRLSTSQWGIFTVVIFLVGTLFHMVYMQFISHKGSDLSAHLMHAENIEKRVKSYPGNFLMYYLINLVRGHTAKYTWLAWLMAGSIALKFFLTFSYFKKSIGKKYGFFVILGLALAFLFISVFIGINLYKSIYYMGNFVPTIWHNSTTVMLIPFAMLLFYLTVGSIRTPEPQQIFAVLFLIILNAIIKPSFLFVTVAFTFIMVLLDYFKTKKINTTAILYLFFCLAVIVMQYVVIYYLNIGTIQNKKSGIGLSFLNFYRRFNRVRDFPISFLSSYLFPITLLLANRSLLKSRALQAAWFYTLVSILIFTFINETGGRAYDGNFYWQIVPSSYILMLISVKYFFLRFKKLRLKYLLSFLLLGHIVYGIIYFCKILITHNYS